MPTYSYRCPRCGHEYDKFQRISDNTRAKCPECGTRGERVITGGAGLVFKGSGFYVTDYKRAGEKRPSEETAKQDASKHGHSESKTAESEPTERGKSKTGEGR